MRYVAFLRGINVGGHVVKMERLRQEFETLGLSNVRTFIASGNIVFDTDVTDLEQRIEAHLAVALGYGVATFLRTHAELAAIAAHQPFPTIARTDRDSEYIVFLQAPPPPAVRERIAAHSSDRDVLHLNGRDLHWLTRGALTESTLSYADWARLLGDMPTTVRNVNTVRRLAARLGPPARAS